MGPTIGIVGGGTAAACVINALAELLPGQPGAEAGEIVVFDDTRQWWRGRAYQDDGNYVWCNSPMSAMSVRHHDPGHGLAWMRASGLPLDDPTTGQPAYLPRPVYGDYLQDSTHEAITSLEDQGWSVRLVGEHVTDIRCDSRELLLQTQSGRCHGIDAAVLAPGGDTYADPYRLSGAPGFLASPYPLDKRLAGIHRGSRVGVLGSGLAAVDVAIALEALGHDGPITLFSRRGLLPAVRGPHTAYELSHLVPQQIEQATRGGTLTLTTLSGLIEAELRAAGSSLGQLRHVTGPASALADLSAQLDAFQTSGDIGPQVLQKAVATVGQDLWYLLGDQAKQWVLDHFHRRVMALCCPMPAFNASRVAHLLVTGQLTIRSGTSSACLHSRGGFNLQTTTGPVRVDMLINTVTPARRHVPGPARHLVRNATASGQLSPHTAGGIHIARHTSQALDTHGRPQTRLYVLGELTCGAFYFISGMPVLTRRSADIAEHIAKSAAPATAAATVR